MSAALLLLLVIAQPDPRVAFLTRQLGEAKDPRARAQAALLLATTGEPAAVPPLCTALGDSAELVRSAAARALGTLEDVAGLDCLERHGQDAAPDVQGSVAGAVKTLEAIAHQPPHVYIAVASLQETSPQLAPDLRQLLDERLQLKISRMGGRLAPAGETKAQARQALGKLRVKGFLLRPEVTPQPSGGLRMRLLCLTYPEKAILGEVSVQAAGAEPSELIRALVPKALDDAADTFDWRQ